MSETKASAEIIERNYQFIKDKMLEQMRDAITTGRKLIDSELQTGIFDIITKPIVNAFYKYWSNKDLKDGTLVQIKTTLDAAKELIKNGTTQEIFERVVDQTFPMYLSGDQTDRQCKKHHKNYKKLREINKKAYISQLKGAIYLLKVKEAAHNYSDLVRIVYKEKETARISLTEQLDFTDECIKIVERDPSILSVITAKKLILKVLRKGFEQTRVRMNRDLDEIFK
jgi:glutamine synthetase type III